MSKTIPIAELRKIARENNVKIPLGGKGFSKEKLYNHLLLLKLIKKTKVTRPESDSPKSITLDEIIDDFEHILRHDIEIMNISDLDDEQKISDAINRKPESRKLKVQVNNMKGKYGPYYAIEGEHTLQFKKRRSDYLLPPNYTDKGKLINPKFLSNVGWMYAENDNNAIILGIYQHALNVINKKYFYYSIVDSQAPLDAKYGILGWDFPFEEASWIKDILGEGNWDPALNPSFREDGTWLHSKCSIDTKTLEKSLLVIKNAKSNKWKSLYPKIIIIMKDSASSQLGAFLKTKDTAASIGWNGHLRFLYRDIKKKTITIFDPWMQKISGASFNKLKKVAKDEYGYTITFEARKPEQGDEGSCGVDSLARVIMVAEYGLEGARREWSIKEPEYFNYPLLAHRLISIKRN